MDFRAHLSRQLSFLKRSCEAYDTGATDEAIRMATVIRVLVHDTKASTSLLKHLNATTINLITSTEDPPRDAIMFYGIGVMSIGGNEESKYFAPLDFGTILKPVPVSKWWNQIVFILNPQTQLSRRKIVLSAANQDGGTHVDAKLSMEYEALSANGSIGHFTYTNGNTDFSQPVSEVHFVAIRQMAYELLNSPQLNALAAHP